jgi:uncharacterized membrane protein YedE/YeeE
MRQLLSAFLIGTLFSGGLIVSGMTNPAKVQNFLDLLGQWDPSLAFVMGGAFAVAFIGFRLAWRRQAPLDHDRFELPRSAGITRSLIIGSVLFGAGWGLAGLCPGPAVAVIPMAPLRGLIFFAGLYGGVLLHGAYESRTQEQGLARTQKPAASPRPVLQAYGQQKEARHEARKDQD